jgi:DNA (cytosine-5)-methyltransferase 1
MIRNSGATKDTQYLTKRQNQIFVFMKNYIAENGIAPTIEEIRKKMKLSAPSTVHEHLDALKKKGYISKNAHTARGVGVSRVQHVAFQVSIVGFITAGKPLEALENDLGEVTISGTAINSAQGLYALRVVGDSMIDEGIFDGDIVVIKKQSVAENGQTVVAIIDDNEATLKKLYKENGRFRLEPRNQNFLPFYRDDVEVRGVVIQVISHMAEKQPLRESTQSKTLLRTIDLFAGVGGVRLGFEKMGFKTVFANDFEAQCKATYDLNFRDAKLVVEDIRKIGVDDLPEFDILLGGFPCQAFSIAGHRQGFEDEKGRGNLFFDVARIIEARKPLGFLLENVKNLKSHDGGKTFHVIQKTLTDLGYTLHAKVLNSMEYGNIPQNRERIYIVGFKNKIHAERFVFPEPQRRTVEVVELLEKNVLEKYYYNGKPLYEKLKKEVTDEGVVYQWRRQYVRANKSGVCPTLTANMGTGGHNVPIVKDAYGIRKLTPRECARLQGFPSDYKLPDVADSVLYKQFGNSVSVPVIERIAKVMREAINS